MGTTVFIALQCCQCSTMQVKQKPKSSNKWSCVVCNQKQSIQKVFAQGYMAKDIRLFVQSFNMSRKSLDENLNVVIGEEEDDRQMLTAGNQRKRRTDWSEYIEAENHHEKLISDEKPENGGELMPKVLTEFPKDMFKKPKLNKYTSRQCDANLYKPEFSKRNGLTKVIKESMTSKPHISKGVSKWDDYLAQDEEDGLQNGSRTNLTNHMSESSNHVRLNETNDDRVEEDIHPDFM